MAAAQALQLSFTSASLLSCLGWQVAVGEITGCSALPPYLEAASPLALGVLVAIPMPYLSMCT